MQVTSGGHIRRLSDQRQFVCTHRRQSA